MTSVIIGEAIVDCVQLNPKSLDFKPVNGGSPYNVALSLARLSSPVSLASSISQDVFGRQFLTSLDSENIKRDNIQLVEEPSTLAMVQSDEYGKVSYSFYINQTSIEEFSWNKVKIEGEHDHIHPGSYVALEDKISTECLSFVRGYIESKLITFDLNIRLNLTPDNSSNNRLEGLIKQYASLIPFIKASDEDLAIIYPKLDPIDAAKELLKLGPEILVVTMGSSGSLALHRASKSITKVEPHKINKIGDSVGAGDSFMASCIYFLRQQGLMSKERLSQITELQIQEMLTKANHVAAINCESHGCNPPTIASLSW